MSSIEVTIRVRVHNVPDLDRARAELDKPEVRRFAGGLVVAGLTRTDEAEYLLTFDDIEQPRIEVEPAP